jgi:topoisomerase-4 subunit B
VAEKIAELAIMNAQSRLKTGKKVVRKKIVSGPALPGKLSDCISHDT